MKKLIFAASAALLLLSSCGEDEKVNTQTSSYPVYNLVTPVNGIGEPELSLGTYSLLYDFANGKVTTSCTNVAVGGKAYKFGLEELPFKLVYSTYGETAAFSSTNPLMTTSPELNVNNLKCEVTTSFLVYPSAVPGVTGMTNFNPLLLMSYNIGNEYTVRTFVPDNTFSGKTMTTFTTQDGASGSYANDRIIYRAVLRVQDKKADVVIYRAKFAEQAPEIAAMILKDLDLEFNGTGYVIRGTEVIPEVVEGTGATPNTRYPFNSFVLSTTNSTLTSVRCEYTVSSRFNGVFSGSVLLAELGL